MAEITDYARRYRPKSLSEYIGNENIVKTVEKILNSPNDKPQVLLFHGMAGCGKTTLARLICAAYSCQTPKSDGQPCGTCPICKEFSHYIETGDNTGLMDITEIDNADDNGKKDIGELLDSMYTPSLLNNWKCYIFDECHLLTPAAQARLLKTVEEPPEKVLICLCTTNPEKLLDTIRSRCQYIFKIQKPKRQDIVTLLTRICLAENVTYEPKALSIIATKGELTPRKSIHYLQAVIKERGSVLYNDAVDVLNIISDKNYFLFYRLLLAEKLNTYQYIIFISQIEDKAQFLDGLLAFTVRGIYIYNNAEVEGLEKTEIKAYAELFKMFKPSELVYMIDYLVDLRNSPDLEIKLLRLGYTGIHNKVNVRESEEIAPDTLLNISTDASSDSESGMQQFQAKTIMTEAERTDIINAQMTPVGTEDILSAFQGTIIDT